MLKPLDISVTVADARFCKPLDTDLIKLLGKEHEFLLTVEEGSIGGFGSHLLNIVGILYVQLNISATVLKNNVECQMRKPLLQLNQRIVRLILLLHQTL